MGIEGYFYGVRNKGVGLNRSFLADLLMTVPPMLLFVPDNGVSEKQFDISNAVASIRFYQQLFDHLKAIAVAHGHDFAVDRDTPVLEEKYDANAWPEYAKRYFAMIAQCAGVRNVDSCGAGLSRFTEQEVISKRLFLDEWFRHFALDPMHLRSILANDYGGFRAKLFQVLYAIIASSVEKGRQPFALRVAGIQFFYSLKLLEDRLDIDTRLLALGVSSEAEEEVSRPVSREPAMRRAPLMKPDCVDRFFSRRMSKLFNGEEIIPNLFSIKEVNFFSDDNCFPEKKGLDAYSIFLSNDARTAALYNTPLKSAFDDVEQNNASESHDRDSKGEDFEYKSFGSLP